MFCVCVHVYVWFIPDNFNPIYFRFCYCNFWWVLIGWCLWLLSRQLIDARVICEWVGVLLERVFIGIFIEKFEWITKRNELCEKTMCICVIGWDLVYFNVFFFLLLQTSNISIHLRANKNTIHKKNWFIQMYD